MLIIFNADSSIIRFHLWLHAVIEDISLFFPGSTLGPFKIQIHVFFSVIDKSTVSGSNLSD